MSKKDINVVVADDFDLIRQGLMHIINFEATINIVAEAKDGEEAIEAIQKLQPDVVVLDMNMPKKDGLDVLRVVKKEYPSIKVIMLTIENNRKVISEAITIGADGYILKDSVAKEIVCAIESVYAGEKYVDQSLVSMLFSGIKKNIYGETCIFDQLSPRELEILHLISKGNSNKEIAASLYISEKTVKNYITKLFKKIDVKDRVKATILSIEQNLDSYILNDYKG